MSMSTNSSTRGVRCCTQNLSKKGVQCCRNRKPGMLTCWQHENLEDFVHQQLVDAGEKMFTKVKHRGKEWMAPFRFPNELPIVNVADSEYIQGSSSSSSSDADDDDDDDDAAKLSGDEEVVSGGGDVPKVRFAAAAQRLHRQHRGTSHRLHHHPGQIQESVDLLLSARDTISELTSGSSHSGTGTGFASTGGEQQQQSQTQQTRGPSLSPLRDLRSPSTSTTTDALDQPHSLPMSPASTANLMDRPLPEGVRTYLSRFRHGRARRSSDIGETH
ncbi:hypothetical protein IWX49DRAFT_640764 [Phyllosticta citricarpa]|uniref:Uncharacterized protein n=2 Tax=Phyllosticta TaxID=121621 RepID=A0ABR1L9D1_9PEZI